jgi:hypothetical protein
MKPIWHIEADANEPSGFDYTNPDPNTQKFRDTRRTLCGKRVSIARITTRGNTPLCRTCAALARKNEQ